VAVLDNGAVAGGMTQRTTAHISNMLDDRYFEVEKLHGREGSAAISPASTATCSSPRATAGRRSSASSTRRGAPGCAR
jgi:hypothetical protein